jgi:hypothetical protein
VTSLAGVLRATSARPYGLKNAKHLLELKM